MNLLIKYTDTNLLVPSDSDVDLTDEFNNVIKWAAENKMKLNHQKTKEIMFRRLNPKLIVYPVPLQQIDSYLMLNF